MIEYKQYGGMNYIEFSEAREFPGLKLVMTIRNPHTASELKMNIAALFGIGESAVATVTQVHGRDVAVIDDLSAKPPASDAMITRMRMTALAVFTADCVPVALYAPDDGALGIVHAGKKGTAEGVTRIAVERMSGMYGIRTCSMAAFIGPSIGPCCYDLDLWKENERQLQSAGVARIINPRICTGCNTDRYFSYRREKGTQGRMVTAIMLEE